MIENEFFEVIVLLGPLLLAILAFILGATQSCWYDRKEKAFIVVIGVVVIYFISITAVKYFPQVQKEAQKRRVEDICKGADIKEVGVCQLPDCSWKLTYYYGRYRYYRNNADDFLWARNHLCRYQKWVLHTEWFGEP